MLRIKKNTVTTIIQTVLMASTTGVLSPSMGSTLPEMTLREMFTTWVKGRTANATRLSSFRKREVSGKKVPQRKNMGVRKRKEG